jgi:hypothetical protein
MVSNAVLTRRLRPWRDLIRVMAVLAVALAGSWLAIYYILAARIMVTVLQMNDFGKFYYSTRLFLDGGDMYGMNPATLVPVTQERGHVFLNMNPPHVHLVVLPLALLTPGWALIGWIVLNVASLTASLRIIVKELRIRTTTAGMLWGLFLALAFAGTGAVIVTGQLSWLLLLPVTLAWRAMRSRAHTRAGFYLGLAMSVKPFLAIFAPCVLRTGPRAAAMAALAVLSAFGLGVAIFGLATHASWIAALRSADWEWAAMNASILGVLSRTLADSPYFVPLVSLPGLVTPLWVAAAVIVAALTLVAADSHRSPEEVDRSFALLLLGSLLVFPLGWVYYVWLLLPPIWSLSIQWLRERRSLIVRREVSVRGTLIRARNVLLLMAIPGLTCPLAFVAGAFQPSPLATATVGSAYFWSVFFLWTALVIDCRAPRKASGSMVELSGGSAVVSTRPGLG